MSPRKKAAGKTIAIALVLAAILIASSGLWPRENRQEEEIRAEQTEQQLSQLVSRLLRKGELYSEQQEWDKSLSAYLQALRQENRLSRNNEVLWKLHFDMSHLLASLKVYGLSARHAKAALSICNSLSAGRAAKSKACIENTYFMLGHLGGVYLEAEQSDSSLHYFRLATKAGLELNEGAYIASLNNIGIWHEKYGCPDSAAFYYGKALQLQNLQAGSSDPGLRYSIQDNQAGIYMKEGRQEQAIELLRKNLSLAKQFNLKRKKLQALAALPAVLLQMKRSGEALPYMNALENELGSAQPSVAAEWKAKLLELRLKSSVLAGNAGAALLYQERLKRFNDSINASNRKSFDRFYESVVYARLLKLEQDAELHQLKLSKKEEQFRLADQRARYNLLLVILIVCFSVPAAIFLVRYHRRKMDLHKKEQELLATRNQLIGSELRNKELESERLKHELNTKSDSLSDLAIYLGQLCSQNEELMGSLMHIRRLGPVAQQRALKEMAMQLQLQMQTDGATGLRLKNIEKVNKEFYNRLDRQFPGLSRAEKELCGMLKLNMRSSEIASVRNVAPASVKMSRHRLRKKLGLGPEADIYAFVQNL